ncbi:ribosomal protein S7p/S5e-domain-containing protein [Pavlovales sp. CCMP2436]|nr:ribosomal protein S7p/S5e-domain-containing protein [Pavlovales sp. CCMP2436]
MPLTSARSRAPPPAAELENSATGGAPLVDIVTELSPVVQMEMRLRAERISDSKTVVGAMPFYAHISSFRRKTPALMERFARQMMHDGKKATSEGVLRDALARIGTQTGYAGGTVLALAVENVTPLLECRSVSASGGRKLQVPTPVAPNRAEGMALRWLIHAARKRSKGQPMWMKLAAELTEAAKGEGAAVKKRIEQHKDAERNRVNAHLRSATR